MTPVLAMSVALLAALVALSVLAGFCVADVGVGVAAGEASLKAALGCDCGGAGEACGFCGFSFRQHASQRSSMNGACNVSSRPHDLHLRMAFSPDETANQHKIISLWISSYCRPALTSAPAMPQTIHINT
jgi:hypothetical protein